MTNKRLKGIFSELEQLIGIRIRLEEVDSILKATGDILSRLGLKRKPNTYLLHNDLGDRIIEELERIGWDLNGEKKVRAYLYFAQDYLMVEKTIRDFFEAALDKETNGKKCQDYLKTALNLTKRASRDVGMSRKISPGCIVNEYDNLPELRDRIYLAMEFPECYEQIAPLYFQMKAAVKKEDYEKAASLRDEIKDITSRVRLQ